jgi:DNA-binding response OmpR family regulator/signal transduction histidine kinase
MTKDAPTETALRRMLDRENPATLYCIGAKAYQLASRVSKDKTIVLSSAINWERFPARRQRHVITNELPAVGQFTLFRHFLPKVQRTDVLEIIAPVKNGLEHWGVLRLGYSLDELRLEIERSHVEMSEQFRAVIARSVATALGMIVLGLPIVAWLSALISKPLQRGTESARQLATGDFSAAARLDIRSQDEVGVPADAFTKMAANLRDSYARLEEYNRDLAQKFDERTRELAKMTVAAEEARKSAENGNSAKSSFLASMSHELRTPLTPIIGFSELLYAEAEAEGRTEAMEDITRVMDSARHLLNLINEILDLSKIEAQEMDLHLERFAIAQVLKETTNTINPLVTKRGNRLVVEAPAAPLRESIRAFRARTLAASESLAAHCATLDGAPFLEDLGRIGSAARSMDSMAADLLGDLFEEKRDLFSLEDLGRTDSTEPDLSGATIFLRKPADAALAPSNDSHIFTRPAAPAPAASILVVDDNEANRALLTRRLARHGHTVAHAEDGLRALELVRRQPFDLVLLDMLMPRMNGHEVLAAIKADAAVRHVPVIMISGLDDTANLIGCIEAGAEDYLSKPFDPVLLDARIGACLEKKRLRDQKQVCLREIEQARRRSDDLLHVILPHAIAEELESTQAVRLQRHENVAVLFSDVAGFTAYCDQNPPERVMDYMQTLVCDTVNTAARVAGVPATGAVFVSSPAWRAFEGIARGRSAGVRQLKGKGEMEIYCVEAVD